MATIDELCEAIGKCERLIIDTSEGQRTVDPHAVYRSTKGKDLLECWQVSGTSSSQESCGWKHIALDSINSVTATGETFTAAEGYNPASTYRKAEVYCRL